MIPKCFPHHLPHFLLRNSTNFTTIWAHFVACMMEFSCILDIPCSERSVFLVKKFDPKRHPKVCKMLPTTSKCRGAIFLIILSRWLTNVSLGSLHAQHAQLFGRKIHFVRQKNKKTKSFQPCSHLIATHSLKNSTQYVMVTDNWLTNLITLLGGGRVEFVR